LAALPNPDDAGCQALLIERLEKLGFKIEKFALQRRRNLWARRGERGPLVCFAGTHRRGPSGPGKRWDSDPFRACSARRRAVRARRRPT